jgi:hypothetical protein
LSITRSQVSDFTSGTVAQAGTATYAVNSGTAVYATTSGTAVFANTSGTATFATNSGTAVFATNAGTAVGVSGSAITQSQVVNLVSDLAGKANLAGGNALTGAQTVTSTAIGQVPLTLIGASGQTANLFSVQDSTGSVRVRINQVGNSTFAGNITSQNNALFTPFSAATIPLAVQGAASQTANLTEWRDSSGNIHSGILSTGFLFVGGSSSAGGQIGITAEAATNRGMVIKGASGQTANLQEWQNSGGTVLSRVLSDGSMFSASFTNNNGRALIGENTAGGTLRLERATGAQTNPGANYARIYFRDGTDAGTLKLVVRAGASGAETTILDNIPQT